MDCDSVVAESFQSIVLTHDQRAIRVDDAAGSTSFQRSTARQFASQLLDFGNDLLLRRAVSVDVLVRHAGVSLGAHFDADDSNPCFAAVACNCGWAVLRAREFVARSYQREGVREAR